MNPKTLEAKKAHVQEISDRLKSAHCVIIMSYQGLDVATFTKLRKNLRDVKADDQPVKAGVEVQKNTLVRRALEEYHDEALEKLLKGANAIVTCDDPLAALSTVSDFCEKNHKVAQIKGGLIDQTFMDEKQIAEIASCGSRKGIYSMFLSVIEAGMRNLALDIKAIAEKKQAESPATAAPAAPAAN